MTEVLTPPTAPMPRWSGGWTQTGRWRWRERFILGPRLEVEVERSVWAPRYSGHTPENWVRETQWWKGEDGMRYPPEGKVS